MAQLEKLANYPDPKDLNDLNEFKQATSRPEQIKANLDFYMLAKRHVRKDRIKKLIVDLMDSKNDLNDFLSVEEKVCIETTIHIFGEAVYGQHPTHLDMLDLYN